MDLAKVKEIYFIGIAGIGMSAVAAMAKQLGYNVSGSDQEKIYPPASTVLLNNKIDFYRKYHADHVKNPDLAVVSAGETPTENPEFKTILKKKIPAISFPELLYSFTKDKTRIVITGTHGKTTTASLIAYSLNNSKNETGFFIGGYVKDFDTNYSISAADNFIIEGDEYYSSYFDKRPKFLHYHPSILVITNVDMDHYDYYKNLNDLMDKFKKLIKSMPPNGVIVACHDDLNVKRLLKNCDKKIIWYGLKGTQIKWRGGEINYNDNYLSFTAKNLENKEKEKIKLTIIGDHNIRNCLATIATLDYLKIPLNAYKDALAKFQGSKRRFEVMETVNNITVIDDYAHHPTAVKATLEAARSKYPNRRIWAIFEPHTFSRTKATLDELSNSFQSANYVIIPDIYPAREKSAKGNFNSKKVVDQIKKFHHNVHYIPSKDKVVKYLIEQVRPNDVVIVMAVGDFNQVADLLINRLRSGNN